LRRSSTARASKERITPRYNYVLDGMLKAGAIDASEASEAKDNLPKFQKKQEINRFSGPKGYLLQLVRDQMNDLEFTPEQVDGGGLRIVTSLDYSKQMKAIDSVNALRPDGKEDLHQSLVSIQPGTGAVRAMYAGRDYLKNQVNWATSRTQPGSTFKPFAVVAALENGYSLRTLLNGNSPLLNNSGEQIAENQGDSGGASFGRIPLSMATQESVNTAFVDLMEQMDDGPDKTLEAAQEAGIPASLLDKVREGGAPLVTPLGYFPVAPVDMANAYATLAANGKRADWYVIERVSDSGGTVAYKHEVETEQAIDKDVVADTISAMQGVVRSGTGVNGRTVCPTAGKTGTATAGPDDDQHVSSSWFAGFTPKLATTVMYNRGENGNSDLENYMVPFFGGQIPAKTFSRYMNGVLDPGNCGTFPPPANIKADQGTDYIAPRPKPKPKPKPKPSTAEPTAPEPTVEPTQPEPTQPTQPTQPFPTPKPKPTQR
jgi:membrane peptidoglycan carboxypeptidase